MERSGCYAVGTRIVFSTPRPLPFLPATASRRRTVRWCQRGAGQGPLRGTVWAVRAVMAAWGKSCRRSGHVMSAVIDPKPTCCAFNARVRRLYTESCTTRRYARPPIGRQCAGGALTPSDVESSTDRYRVGLGFETEISRRALDFHMAQECSNRLQIAGALQNVESLRPAQRF